MKISNFFLVLLFCLYSGNLSAEIFYIDIDKIINQTNVGKYINKEFENSKKINDSKNLESIITDTTKTISKISSKRGGKKLKRIGNKKYNSYSRRKSNNRNRY